MKSIFTNLNNINTTHLAGASLSLWFVLNISTLILNKYIYSSLYFYYPITLTAIHMLLCWVGSVFVLKVYKLIPLIQISWSSQFFNILILSILFCSNIVFGNVSLRWVPVSFMQTVKSSVPLFTVILQTLFFSKRFSRDTYLSMIPIVGGVCLASVSEVNFNQAGFIAALASSVLSAIFAIVSGLILTQQMNAVNLLYYMSPISFCLLFPIAAFTEFESIQSEWALYGESRPVVILALSGVIAFLLNTFTFLVIKFTSPLTYTVSGNLKVVLSITISILIFKNETNFLNIVGCAIAVIGVIWYSQIRYEASKPKVIEVSNLLDSNEIDKEKLLPK
ncbi:hypothetical protein DICPUDRAFT_92094 [Dictyostelium purpureum]|uniref:Sugar phosphate transporter domain-containing protein n=1 Tax=Dictyostelium purpureum TaxID=5786 RepID=F0ZLY1_DICPU|nr:uncharacterized protein DICPUDRAFT_92094 [Dictyostelium purpureum]EGC35066.1 hypothetical protein DICPUDRAFT_92094 [Dictyostelium purpureum]|eukprot:XP_003288434.1 hypothetical protein DICPUDRAFT_92094 [Dictyostelium purpureum]